MNKLQNLGRIGLMGLVASGAGACMTEEAEPLRPAPITTLSLTNGAQVDFYDMAGGGLLVAAKGELSREVEHLKPLELYEALADGPAPVVLREAQVRVDTALAARPPRGPATTDKVSDPGQGGSSLVADDFRAQYCSPSAVDFDYCWTEETNNKTVDISGVSWIHSHVNAYTGEIRHSVYQKTLFGWDPVFSEDVTGANYVSLYDTFDNDRYRIEITQATAAGDRYHLSIHGNQ
jgi:hypothetical protein